MFRDEVLNALKEEILALPDMRVAPQRRALFEHLWANRGEYSTAIDIWEQALHKHSRSKKKDAADYRFDYAVTERCDDLRVFLSEYFRKTKEGWIVNLPLGSPGKGYRLECIKLDDSGSPTLSFWRPHFGDHEVGLIYVEPVFYYDFQTVCYLRFLDTNPLNANPLSATREAAFTELERLHADEIQQLFGKNARERLRPTHVYVGIGEVGALDVLSEWFRRLPCMRVEKHASENIASLQKLSPVLIGSTRTNRFINSFMRSEEGHHFRFRNHETTVGFVTISNATDEEKVALRKFQTKTDEKGRTVAIVTQSISAVRDRFVIVTRMPKPDNPQESVTIISSETGLAIRQVADLLTDDKKITPVLNKLGWPQKPLPTSFQFLFSVRIAPGNMDDEASLPQLLATEKYD